MNHASVVQRLFGRTPVTTFLVEAASDDLSRAAAKAGAAVLADFGDAPHTIAQLRDNRFAAIGRTHAVLVGAGEPSVALLPETEGEDEVWSVLVRDITPVEKTFVRQHVKHGRKAYRFGKFRPGMRVKWRDETWVVYDARYRGPSKFDLMLISPDYSRMASNVPPAEIGESETVESDDPFAGNAWVQASRDIAKLHAEKPRSINRMFGPNPTDEQKAKHAELMREWSKKDREARKRLKAAKAAANETVGESQSFTPAHLEQLRTQFAQVKTVDPSSPTYDRMIKLLDGMTQHQLKQVAGANIKFLSKLALNRVKKGESVGEARVRRVLWSTKVGGDTWGAAVFGPHFFATLNGEDYDFEDGEVQDAPKAPPAAVLARLEKSRLDFDGDKATTRESVEEAKEPMEDGDGRPGDKVVVIGNVAGKGKRGKITSIAPSGSFATVQLTNGEERSYHLSDLSLVTPFAESVSPAWGRYASLIGESFVVFDRYSALGVPRPNPATMCLGPCDGTGVVPVRQDEQDQELHRRWEAAERAASADDGWHFVQCPACEGSRLREAGDDEIDRVQRDLEYARADARDPDLNAKAKAKLQAKVNALDAKLSKLLAARKEAEKSGGDGDGKWRTTQSGHKIFIDGDGKVTKGNPYVIGKTKESVGESWRMEAGFAYEGKTIMVMRDQTNFGFVVDGEMVQDGFSSRAAALKAAKKHVDELPVMSEAKAKHAYAVGDRVDVRGEGKGKIVRLRHDSPNAYEVSFDKGGTKVVWDNPDGAAAVGYRKVTKVESVAETRANVAGWAITAGADRVTVRSPDGDFYTADVGTKGEIEFLDSDEEVARVPGAVVRAVQRMLSVTAEGLDEARVPHWRTLVDELMDKVEDIERETEVHLRVSPTAWKLLVGPQKNEPVQRGVYWGEGTIDPGMTPEDAKELAVDLIDQVRGMRQQDESSGKAAPKMRVGEIWALSYTGPVEDPDVWLFVATILPNGTPEGVQYDVRSKKAIFMSFGGHRGKFARQDSDAFRELTSDSDPEAALRVTNTLARHGGLKHFPGIAESLSKQDQDSIDKMAPGSIKQAQIDKARRDAHYAKPSTAVAADWQQFEGILVMRRPGSPFVAVPVTGKKSSKLFDVIRVEGKREHVAQIKSSEVGGFLARLDRQDEGVYNANDPTPFDSPEVVKAKLAARDAEHAAQKRAADAARGPAEKLASTLTPDERKVLAVTVGYIPVARRKQSKLSTEAYDTAVAGLKAKKLLNAQGALTPSTRELMRALDMNTRRELFGESIDEAAYGSGVEVTPYPVRGSKEKMWLVRKDGTLLGYVTKFNDTRTDTNPWKAFRYKNPTKADAPENPDAEFLGTTYRGKLKGAVAAVVSGQKLVQDTPESVEEANRNYGSKGWTVAKVAGSLQIDKGRQPYRVVRAEFDLNDDGTLKKVVAWDAHHYDDRSVKLEWTAIPKHVRDTIVDVWRRPDAKRESVEEGKADGTWFEDQADAEAQAIKWGRNGIAGVTLNTGARGGFVVLTQVGLQHTSSDDVLFVATRGKTYKGDEASDFVHDWFSRDFRKRERGVSAYGPTKLGDSEDGAQSSFPWAFHATYLGEFGQVDEATYYLIRRDDGKFLDGTEWVDEDPGFGFRDMATARKAASDAVIRGKLRKGQFQIVTRDTSDVDEAKLVWSATVPAKAQKKGYVANPTMGQAPLTERCNRCHYAEAVDGPNGKQVKCLMFRFLAASEGHCGEWEHRGSPYAKKVAIPRESVEEGYQHVHFNGSKSARAKVVMAGGKTKSVQGRTFDGILLIHPTGNYQWGVTHIPTGLGLVPHPGFADDREAVRFANAASALGGWDFTDPQAVPPDLAQKMSTLIASFRSSIRRTGGGSYESAELLRASKLVVDGVEPRRLTRVWRSDGKVLEQAGNDPDGWKVDGVVKAELLQDPTKLCEAMTSTRSKLEAAGWTVESFNPPA